ncbi:MAG: hypothetical protein ABIQ32_00870 [Sphingomicrobium sp.]
MDYLEPSELAIKTPTVLGELIGGISLTGLTLYATRVRTAPSHSVAKLVAVDPDFATPAKTA